MSLVLRPTLPRRRYAVFTSILRGDYTIVVRGSDIERAPTWGGFVGWLGAEKPASILKPQDSVHTRGGAL